MVHDVDSAKGLPLRFRHLAGELRRASPHPNAAREFERLRFRASHALRDAFAARLLPTPILDEFGSPGSSTGTNVFWEYQPIHFFVGYCEPSEYLEPLEYDEESGCCSGGHRAVFLKPGAVSLVWPGVFESVFCGDFPDTPQFDVKEIARTAWVDERFTIMGYYATACELLADWIENHTNNDREHDGKPDQDGGDTMSDLADGLYASRDLFVWGGKRYDRLTNKMKDVLAVLWKEFPSGRKVCLDEMMRRVPGNWEGGFYKCFRCKRGGVDGVHPVKEIVQGRGTYRLIDPKEIPR